VQNSQSPVDARDGAVMKQPWAHRHFGAVSFCSVQKQFTNKGHSRIQPQPRGRTHQRLYWLVAERAREYEVAERTTSVAARSRPMLIVAFTLLWNLPCHQSPLQSHPCDPTSSSRTRTTRQARPLCCALRTQVGHHARSENLHRSRHCVPGLSLGIGRQGFAT
jgi:hypothetical protein